MEKQFVATSYVYDKPSDSFMLIFHNKLKCWLPPGGHLLNGEVPHEGALRELEEETGVKGKILNVIENPNTITETTPQLPNPFCILYETIPKTEKEDQHIHIDFVYAVELSETKQMTLDINEVSSLKWFTVNDIQKIDTFDNIKKVSLEISRISKL